ncbi:N-acetyltransferase 9-like protein [Pollicipes pollicipes]|uniref:N-acetyltransferase 9-like protein n=1 Tax=Pollicipes pollicipes TaxID=41117 RepID=UPI001884F5B1|nr:N-acetyltransferase 9-like protein [Pollicipes pollicipes]
MRTNACTVLWTELLTLVPYRRRHVPKYHSWMQSAELQQLTASEPLTLPQEYAMQRSWREDDGKCTFIVLDRATYESAADEVAAMIGDVNLFLADGEAGAAEVEVMIAEQGARGAGRGRQAAAAMLRYGLETLRLTRFQVKIGLENEASRHLFATLGFAEVSRSEVFGEVTCEVHVTPDWRRTVERMCPGYRAETVADGEASEPAAAGDEPLTALHGSPNPRDESGS